MLKGLAAEVTTLRQLDGGVKMVVKGPTFSAIAVKAGDNSAENYESPNVLLLPHFTLRIRAVQNFNVPFVYGHVIEVQDSRLPVRNLMLHSSRVAHHIMIGRSHPVCCILRQMTRKPRLENSLIDIELAGVASVRPLLQATSSEFLKDRQKG